MDIPYKIIVHRDYGDRFWASDNGIRYTRTREVIYCDNLTDAEGLRDEIKRNDKYAKGVSIMWADTVLNYE